jgi:Ni/Fe-hydrogenase subunit HybB-like protein
VFSALGAVYTAFLFAQAQGRDLWQSPLLPWHMLVQSVMAGSAGLLLANLFLPAPDTAHRVLVATFSASALAALLMTVAGEFGVPHASLVAEAAARLVTRGRYAAHYAASLALLLLPAILVLPARASQAAVALSALLALAGLLLYEWAYVMAPQQVPNN